MESRGHRREHGLCLKDHSQFCLDVGPFYEGVALRALVCFPPVPLCQSLSALGRRERLLKGGGEMLPRDSEQPKLDQTSLSGHPLPSPSLPPRPLRAELRASCYCFCESSMIIICIKFDCLNRSGLIGTNTRSCALPVISDSLANAFCKIALDFNNRLLVLERCAHFLSNCQRSPHSWCPGLC